MELTLITEKIYVIRGQKVILDFDLANLYEVETRVLKQAVRRNILRFPEDFMFELSEQEMENWRSQIVMSNPSNNMGLRYKPFAFTEQGVAMLSSVLKSEKAISVNISIIRAFIILRNYLAENKEIQQRLLNLETGMHEISNALTYLLQKDTQKVNYDNRPKIEFK